MKSAANETAHAALPKVEVMLVQPASYQAEVIGYGETKPRFELDYASEVNGRVIWLSDSFEAGSTVKQGQLLAKLDSTAYEQAVAQAKYDVASAQQALLEEQRQGEQALSEWQRSGLQGEPNSPLVLRKPQLASAKAKLQNAQQTLEKAQQDLDNTQIYAPFDGVVVSREIQPSSYVSAGGAIATLHSIDKIEIEVALSEKEWATLPQMDSENPWTATITDSTGRQQWLATVERSYQFVEQQTRQRSLVLVVDKPLEQASPLFSGTFVQAQIQGTEIDNLWQLPASALSQQGEVWTVDAQGLLAKTAVTPLFEYQQHIYVSPIQDADTQVVIRPLSNYKAGMKVEPQASTNTRVALHSEQVMVEEG